MGVLVLRGICPTNRGSCLIGVIVLRCRCPKGYLSWWVICRGVVIVLWELLSYGVVAPRVVISSVVVLGVVVPVVVVLEPLSIGNIAMSYLLLKVET